MVPGGQHGSKHNARGAVTFFLRKLNEQTPGVPGWEWVSGVGVVNPGFFFGEVFLAFEVEAGTHFGEP